MLVLALLTAPSVWGQILTGKGFTADPNGYRSDEPVPRQQQEVAPGTIIKDCPECPEMVVLPGGSFVMGADHSSDRTSASEFPQHRVQIQSFAIGKYEVTQEQWFAVMGNNPSYYKGRTLPVEQVSWEDIQEFIAKLNQKTGQRYRLPNEAEWEYAARAGTTTEWSFGNDESKLGDYAWYDRNSGRKTQAVGQKLPNAFGLFDVHGNVWEWTQDCWHEDYSGAPTDGSAWTSGCTRNRRMLRGGSYYISQSVLRSADRNWFSPNTRSNFVGFRIARTL